VIFDRCAPETLGEMPMANTYFIDSVPPPWKRSAMPPLKAPLIRNSESKHPLMRDVTGLDEILILGGAFHFDLSAQGLQVADPSEKEKLQNLVPARNRLLEIDGERSVLFVLPGARRSDPFNKESPIDRTRAAYQDLVMTFPFVNNQGEWATTWNWDLRLPVFLGNVLYQMGNISDTAAEENVQPGEEKLLRPDRTVDRVEVQPPAGRSREVKRASGAAFSFQYTDQTGVYRATWPGGGRSFAVNLLDAEESNTQPRDEIKVGDVQVQAGGTRKQTYDTWKWVALGALVLLVLEWVMYHRRNWW
jgi:hypothetical protein